MPILFRHFELEQSIRNATNEEHGSATLSKREIESFEAGQNRLVVIVRTVKLAQTQNSHADPISRFFYEGNLSDQETSKDYLALPPWNSALVSSTFEIEEGARGWWGPIAGGKTYQFILHPDDTEKANKISDYNK